MPYESHKGYDFELTGRIIAAAIEVHKTLGPGFQEVIYQRALEQEFMAAGFEFAREARIPVYYKGKEIGRRRVDFLVENIIVEIKARSEFLPQDYVQALSYLKASGYRIGLLLNFGTNQVAIKRLANDNKTYHSEHNGGS